MHRWRSGIDTAATALLSSTVSNLDPDFANVLRFPPENTPGVVRLKVHPPTEDSIRQVIRRAIAMLQDTDLSGRLAVVDPDKIRIRS